jgi:hypothetical protein
MKQVYQTIFTVPGGNCFQAAVASIFEKPLEDIPHFCDLYDDDHWWEEFCFFCLRFGICPLNVEARSEIQFENLGFYLALGKTKAGHDHAVVYANGDLIHDPVPGGEGLVEIESYVIFVSTMFNGVK